MSEFLGDPIVVTPVDFDIASAWQGCQTYVTKMRAAGREVAASFGADPGICSCPVCGTSYWAWGLVQRCKKCQFEYPTDWWSMYAGGVSAANPPAWLRDSPYFQREHVSRINHPYYRYGFEHPVEDAWKERHTVNWRAVV